MTEVLERPRVASPAARTDSPPRHAAGTDQRPRKSSRRADIEGLRAVAVLGVLAFHAALPFIPGGYVGVDVFFVISGFLITGLVAAEVELTGRLSLARFYARRIKRLLPAAVLVLLVTAAASAAVLSPLARRQAGGDIISAALYVSNWHFAAEQTDYLSVQTSPSPVLHYWSLSVEEQYYVLWPLVLLGTVLLARRYHLVTRRAVQLAVVVVGLVSLAWSLLWTTSNPPYAFFGLMTRAWELALGGIIALAAVTLSRLGPLARAALGWGGLAAIVGSMLVLTEDVPFPGTAALLPVLGAGAVIVSGLPRREPTGRGFAASGRDLGPVALLGTRPMRSVGRVSYSLYLWHWPPLVLVPVALGRPLTPVLGVVIVLLACIPAVLSYRYVEEPFRHSTVLVTFPRRAALVATVLTCAAVLAASLVGRAAPAPVIEVAVPDQATGVVKEVRVDPAAARDDVPATYDDNCHAGYGTTVPRRCLFGDTKSDVRVALFGDSHAAMWFPTLLALAKRDSWALEVDTKSSCSPADIQQWEKTYQRAYDECVTYRNALVDAWQSDPRSRPDVVVVASRGLLLTAIQNGKKLDQEATLHALHDGLVRTIQRLQGMGISVVVVRDVVPPGFDIPDCLSTNPKAPQRCAFSEAKAVPDYLPDVAAAQETGATLVDLSTDMCPDGTCDPIIDGDIVYRDGHHVTATYARSLAGAFGEQLRQSPAWSALSRS